MRRTISGPPLLALPVLLALFSPTVASAATAEGVVVSRLEAKSGVTEQDIDSLSGLFTTEVEKHAKGKVISDADVSSLLNSEQRRRLCGATDTQCMAEIGGALGVPEVITGDLGRVGETWILNLRRIDASRAAVLRRISWQAKGTIDAVVSELPKAVASLYDAQSPGPGQGSGTAASAAPSAPAGGGEAAATPGASRWPVWAALGGGAACLALGVVATRQMRAAADDYAAQSKGSADALARHDRWRLAAVGGYAVGAAALVTGVVLWLRTPAAPPAGEKASALRIDLQPTPGGLVVWAGTKWP